MSPRALVGRYRGLVYAGICVLAVAVMAGAFLLYRMSVSEAVNGTTTSFMEQLADHDAQGIHNQMAEKWTSLESLAERLRLTREDDLGEISYLLGVEEQATSFDRIYLVSSDGKLRDGTHLVSSLAGAPWADSYRRAEGRFAARYTLDEREAWGEYVAYGVKLPSPFIVGDATIEGVVGLVPVADMESSMRYESFDGQGLAIVIQPSGEVVTASQYYGGADGQNYFSELREAVFESGSLDECIESVADERDSFVAYQYGGQRFYAMMKPIEDSDWTLVVKVNAAVVTDQVDMLMTRSLVFFGVLGVVLAAAFFVIFRSVRNARVARASEKAKSTFLANMSHEIRTPLNGIVGLQYLMRQNLDDREKLTSYLDQADISAEFLKSVITDVLDMSKIESGQMDLRAAPFDLDKMLHDIDVLFSSQAAARKLRFSVESGVLEAPWVSGDEMRIKQALVNLLGNAVKFTPEGGSVTLDVGQRAEGGIAVTTFVVSDTGCGMSAEFMERMWEPFEQERRMTSQSGTGLGTSLSKVLVEAMGGSIEVASELGRGTTFTVTVPFPVCEREAGGAEDGSRTGTVELKGMRVLVAEDNDVNRMIIVDILTDEGCEVVDVRDGRAAVEAFAQSEPGTFGVVLMDLQMPELDGYGAATAIRALDRPDSARVPIMALTANAFRADVDRALASGMNDVVTKPLDVERLLEKLRSYEVPREGRGDEQEGS